MWDKIVFIPCGVCCQRMRGGPHQTAEEGESATKTTTTTPATIWSHNSEIRRETKGQRHPRRRKSAQTLQTLEEAQKCPIENVTIFLKMPFSPLIHHQLFLFLIISTR